MNFFQIFFQAHTLQSYFNVDFFLFPQIKNFPSRVEGSKEDTADRVSTRIEIEA